MRRVIVICNQCGHEEKIELYTREEAEKQGVRIVPLRCSKCGSPNVITRE